MFECGGIRPALLHLEYEEEKCYGGRQFLPAKSWVSLPYNVMIPYKIFSAIHLGPIAIQPWGVMVAIGFAAGAYIAIKEAKRKNIDIDQMYNLIFWVTISGIIGARISYLIEYWREISSFADIFKIWEGGMGFIGGFFGALIAAYVYVRATKLDFRKIADIFAPALAIGHAIGRIGCYITGLHIGKLTAVPWAVMVNGELRHQTALYEIITNSANFLILWKLRTRKAFDGFLFLLYLMLYGAERFIIDFFRVDPVYYGLTPTQWVFIFIVPVSLFLLLKGYNKHKEAK